MAPRDTALPRRGALAAAAGVAAAATLPACTTYGKNDAPAADPAPTGQPAAPGGAPAAAIAKTSEVPVGGGVIKNDIVVTQPTAGTFVGLSATCTHAGCKVTTVSGGTINCPCHGSKFGLDGAVVTGPAARPLAAKKVRVEGDSIVSG